MVSAMWGGTWDVRRFDEIDSTNAYLRREARQGAREGTAAVADHQSAGRGRMDRRWEAPVGASLLASVLFRPDFDPAELHLCTAAMALAAVEACWQVAGVEPDVKWPNDLLVGEAKLAGILAEAEFEGVSCALVVGIGLNVDWPGPAGVGGTCLRDVISSRSSAAPTAPTAPTAPVVRGAPTATEIPIDRPLLLDALLGGLSTRRGLLDSAPGRRQVAAELRDRCVTLGKRVRVALAS
jgi:BirA family transcriptional regulator, biotin operon repressor / biotin---[acetyl-CoA-carboxylase] ligase